MNKKISHNEALASVSLEAVLLFTWSVAHLDRDGRMVGNPTLVRSLVCPMRADMTDDVVVSALHELVEVGLVQWYEEGGAKVLAFPGFTEEQKGLKYKREAASTYPAYDSTTSQDLIRIYSDNCRTKSPLREVKGSEVEVERKSNSETTSPAAPPNFRSIAAPALRKGLVPEHDIPDSLKNFWPLAVRDSSDEELAAFVTYYGTTKIKGQWNPAAFWNLKNEYGRERFREEFAEWRRDRPKAVDPYAGLTDRTEHVGDVVDRITRRVNA